MKDIYDKDGIRICGSVDLWFHDSSNGQEFYRCNKCRTLNDSILDCCHNTIENIRKEKLKILLDEDNCIDR